MAGTVLNVTMLNIVFLSEKVYAIISERILCAK